jgi:hypothetical protein
MSTVLGGAALALSLALTGCGSSSDSDDTGANQVASVRTPQDDSDGSSAGETGSSDEGKSKDEMLLEAAQCLRDHGFDVDDPAPGEGLQVQANQQDKAQAKAAFEACQHLMPAPDAEDKDQERKDMLAIAKCMRDHGVEHFPDPQPGQGISIGPEIAEDPDFPAAQQACNEAMGAGVPVMK